MQTVLVVVHLLIVIALVIIILLQRSEGGGFGSSNSSNFMTARGAKNALTRLTAILAGCFFFTSLLLVVLDSVSNTSKDVLDRIPEKVTTSPEKDSNSRFKVTVPENSAKSQSPNQTNSTSVPEGTPKDNSASSVIPTPATPTSKVLKDGSAIGNKDQKFNNDNIDINQKTNKTKDNIHNKTKDVKIDTSSPDSAETEKNHNPISKIEKTIKIDPKTLNSDKTSKETK